MNKTFPDLEYDQKNKQPKGFPRCVEMLFALDDWHPGQIFSFEPYFWTHWKRGDVVFFDWRNYLMLLETHHDRPILKIIIIENDDYVLLKMMD